MKLRFASVWLFPHYDAAPRPGVTASCSTNVLGNLGSFFGLSFEEAEGQAAVVVEEVCRL